MGNIAFVLTIIFSTLVTGTYTVSAQFTLQFQPVFTDAREYNDGSVITGEISDSHCGLKHMNGMESNETCVHHCISNRASFVLADKEKGVVYALDTEGEKQAGKFAARKVKVTGHVMKNMIHVSKIEAAQ